MKIKNEIPNINLSGKNVIITGATAGIEKETAGKYFYFGLFLKGIYEKRGNNLINDVDLQEWLWKKSEALIGEEFHIGQYKVNNKYLVCI